MRLDINYKEKNTIINTKPWTLKNISLNNKQVTEEIKRKIKKKFWKQIAMKT